MVENTWFDRLILLIILVNCIFLAMDDKPPAGSDKANLLNVSELVFNIIYTIEMVFKIVAWGFFWSGKYSYMRSPWNQLDFVVVMGGWLNVLFANASSFSALRSLRLLKPLKAISSVPGMQIQVQALLASMPSLLNVLALLTFLLFVFGILGMQLMGGKLSKRCVVDGTTDTLANLTASQVYGICDITGRDGVKCDPGSHCQDVGYNPNNNANSFDNIIVAWLTIMQAISLEGWVDIMYMVNEAASNFYDPYFVLLILFGSLFLINLVVAVIFLRFKLFKEEAERKREEMQNLIRHESIHIDDDDDNDNENSPFKLRREQNTDKIPKFEKQRKKTAMFEALKLEDSNSLTGSTTMSSTASSSKSSIQSKLRAQRKLRHRSNSVSVGLNRMKTGIDKQFTKARAAYIASIMPLISKLVHTRAFDNLILSCIVVNALFLSLEHHNMPQTLVNFLFVSNIVFTVIFTLEMVLKILGLGISKYVSDWFNLFDATIVVFSLLDLFLPESNSSVTALRTFRLLRVFKLFKFLTGLRELLDTVLSTLTDLRYFSLILTLFVFIYALIGTQYFQGRFTFTDENGEEYTARANFDTFFWSLITVFQILTGENWNEVLYDGIKGSGWLSSLYFVSCFMFGNYIILSLFMAILLGNFEIIDADEPDPLQLNRKKRFKKMVSKWMRNRYTSLKTQITNSFVCFVSKRSKSTSTPNKNSNKNSNKNANKNKNNKINPSANQTHTQNLDTQNNDQIIIPKNDLQNKLGSSDNLLASNNNDNTTPIEKGLLLPSTNCAKSESNNENDLKLPNITTNDTLATPDVNPPSTPNSMSRKWNNALDYPPSTGLTSPTTGNSSAYGSSHFIDGDEVSCKDWKPRDLISMQQKNTLLRLRSDKPPVSQDITQFDAKHHSLCILSATTPIRKFCIHLIQNPWFDKAILLLICISSIFLALDEPSLSENSMLKQFLVVADIVITILFCIEMIVKIIAMGLIVHDGSYLRSGWNVLDGSIVIISVFNLFFDGLSFVKGFRALRALRPLRMVSRFKNMKVVVNAIFATIPALSNVVLITLFFFFIFGIVAVQQFKGLLWHCAVINEDGTQTVLDQYDENECNFQGTGKDGAQWVPNEFGTFDNIFSAMLLLFEVASLEQWPTVMYAAVDARGIGKHPARDHNQSVALFFVLFLLVCSFFVLSLFVGVVVDEYQKYHEKFTAGCITDEQREWLEAMRVILNREILNKVQAPMGRWRRVVFKYVTTDTFEYAVTFLIGLNVLAMSLSFVGQPQEMSQALEIINDIFTFIFLCEMLLKWYGLGIKQYFSDVWNIFDAVIVFASLIVWFALFFLDDMQSPYRPMASQQTQFAFDPTIARVLRIFRIFRVIKRAKSLRQLLSTLMYSLPALYNVGLLLLLLFFIYAVAGMALFGNVKHGQFLNIHANFQSFGTSMLTLYRMSTGESWNGIFHDCSIQPENSTCTYEDGNCGSPTLAKIYFLSFVVSSSMVMLNVFVAVVLRNFEEQIESSTRDRIIPVHVLDEFQRVWSKFCEPNGEFIKASRISSFLNVLSKPLGLLEDNKFGTEMERYIWNLGIPQSNGMIHYVDLAMVLTLRVLGDEGSGKVSNIPDENDFARFLRQQMHRSFPNLKDHKQAQINEYLISVGQYRIEKVLGKQQKDMITQLKLPDEPLETAHRVSVSFPHSSQSIEKKNQTQQQASNVKSKTQNNSTTTNVNSIPNENETIATKIIEPDSTPETELVARTKETNQNQSQKCEIQSNLHPQGSSNASINNNQLNNDNATDLHTNPISQDHTASIVIDPALSNDRHNDINVTDDVKNHDIDKNDQNRQTQSGTSNQQTSASHGLEQVFDEPISRKSVQLPPISTGLSPSFAPNSNSNSNYNNQDDKHEDANPQNLQSIIPFTDKQDTQQSNEQNNGQESQ